MIGRDDIVKVSIVGHTGNWSVMIGPSGRGGFQISPRFKKKTDAEKAAVFLRRQMLNADIRGLLAGVKKIMDSSGLEVVRG